MADEPNPTPGGASTDPAPTPEPEPDAESGDGLKRALNSERQLHAQTKKQATEALRRLKEFEDAQKTENERLQERAVTAEKRAAELEQSVLRNKVAAKHELPAELAERLQGATEDELDADAKRLAEYVAPAGDLGGRRGGFVAAGGSDSNDMTAQIRRMTGRT